MNQRIDQLWAQALDAAVPETYTQLSHSQVLKIKQVFADMIVQKCLNIVSNQTTLDTNEDFREGFSHGLKYAWTDIRKHFGIEE